MDYGSDRMWEDLDPAIVATAVDSDGVIYGYKTEPTKLPQAWAYGSMSHFLSCLALENIPPWEKSLRTRPVVRGSQAFWDGAPKWANWSAINSLGNMYWHEKEPRAGVIGWELGGDISGHSRGHSTDNWRNSKIERPYAWKLPDENTPVDTKAWRRGCPDDPWKKANTAGGCYYWNEGRTWWTGGCLRHANQIVLADEDDLSRVPPTDLKLGLET